MCNGKNHNLKVIYWHRSHFNEEPTVRWCQDCGAVVVDMDYDGRTNAGQIRQMEFPKSAYNKEN